jgi:hypothetical protein
VDHVRLGDLDAGELYTLARVHLREDGTVGVEDFELEHVVGKLAQGYFPTSFGADEMWWASDEEESMAGGAVDSGSVGVGTAASGGDFGLIRVGMVSTCA